MEDIHDDIQTLFRMLSARTRVIESLERKVAQLEVEVSELRHASAVTPVDELYEASRCESVGAGVSR